MCGRRRYDAAAAVARHPTAAPPAPHLRICNSAYPPARACSNQPTWPFISHLNGTSAYMNSRRATAGSDAGASILYRAATLWFRDRCATHAFLVVRCRKERRCGPAAYAAARDTQRTVPTRMRQHANPPPPPPTPTPHDGLPDMDYPGLDGSRLLPTCCPTPPPAAFPAPDRFPAALSGSSFLRRGRARTRTPYGGADNSGTTT